MKAESLGRRAVLLAAIALLALPMPGVAWAACARGELGGKYELHIFASTKGGSATWTRCAMTVKASGGLKPGTVCSNDRGGQGEITGGNLKLSRKCSMSGTIQIDETVATLDHGILNQQKDTFSALGKSDNGLILQITATRR